MKTLMLILLATTIATSAFAWTENPAEGQYREFVSAGDRPDENTQPLIENSIEGANRENTHCGSRPDTWFMELFWLLHI